MKFIITIFLLVTTAMAQPNSSAVEKQVNSLLKKMTLEEKIGQMTQVDYSAIQDRPDELVKYSIGSVLWGGGTDPADNSAHGWASMVQSLQSLSEKSRLKIPIIFGVDAVHGHNNVDGAVIFPHNIGLGASRNAELVQKVAAVTAKELKATGIQWDFAPCVAVARDERWGRTYESFGEHPEIAEKLGAAFVEGMQSDKTTLACVKHFLGDGGTTNGKDQGNTECDEKTLREIHLPMYREAIAAGAKSIMVSYSSWNGEKMHGNKYLLTDVLKNEMKFDGFLVSDWAGIEQLKGNFKEQIEASINAGLDMIMITSGEGRRNNYIEYITFLKELVKEKKVPMERIDDAVRRILKAKFEIGLFEKRYGDDKLLAEFGGKEHRETARDAVRQSLVLLKNDANALPLSKNLKNILVVGKAANDMNMQCGGWTIGWQGDNNTPISGGTTILQGIQKSVSAETNVTYSIDGAAREKADAVIVVLGEPPYAEMFGDRDVLSLSMEDELLVRNLRNRNVPVVVVLLSGRPLIINSILQNSSAFVAAWLPGTEGQGIADVLFGDAMPTGKLPHSWPASMHQIPINVGDTNYQPLFPYGFGLTYTK